MQVCYVSKDKMPQGHTWALVAHDECTVAYVVDSAAERVARAVLLQLEKSRQ